MFACSFKVVAQLIVSFYCEFLVAPVGLLPFPAGTNKRKTQSMYLRSYLRTKVSVTKVTLIYITSKVPSNEGTFEGIIVCYLIFY